MNINRLLFVILVFANCLSAEQNSLSQVASPKWTKDLVIYQISTKNFNSPEKSESGTFETVKAKMPYLANVGVNSIWLTGHHYADTICVYPA